jgi:hypothetical protein
MKSPDMHALFVHATTQLMANGRKPMESMRLANESDERKAFTDALPWIREWSRELNKTTNELCELLNECRSATHSMESTLQAKTSSFCPPPEEDTSDSSSSESECEQGTEKGFPTKTISGKGKGVLFQNGAAPSPAETIRNEPVAAAPPPNDASSTLPGILESAQTTEFRGRMMGERSKQALDTVRSAMMKTQKAIAAKGPDGIIPPHAGTHQDASVASAGTGRALLKQHENEGSSVQTNADASVASAGTGRVLLKQHENEGSSVQTSAREKERKSTVQRKAEDAAPKSNDKIETEKESSKKHKYCRIS